IRQLRSRLDVDVGRITTEMVRAPSLLVNEDLHRCRGAWRCLVVALLSGWERDAAEPVRYRLVICLSGFQDCLRRGVAIGRAVGVDDRVLCTPCLRLPLDRCPRRRIGEIRGERASGTHTQDMGAWSGVYLWHRLCLLPQYFAASQVTG